MVFRDGYFNHGVHQNLFAFERIDERSLYVVGEQAGCRHAATKQGKVNGAIGLDTNGPCELRRVVNRNCHQVVDSQLLRRQIFLAGFLHQLRPHLRHRGDGRQREQNDEAHLVPLQHLRDPRHGKFQLTQLLVESGHIERPE